MQFVPQAIPHNLPPPVGFCGSADPGSIVSLASICILLFHFCGFFFFLSRLLAEIP
jgi:hypothetical protein